MTRTLHSLLRQQTDSILADSWISRNGVPSIRVGHYAPSFTLELCYKNLSLVRELTDTDGAPLSLQSEQQNAFSSAYDSFGPHGAILLIDRLIETASVYCSEQNVE